MRVGTLSKARERRPNPDGVISQSFLVGVFVFFFSIACASAETATENLLPILLDEIHTQDLHADDLLSFEFAADANKFYLIEVDQGGLDLVVTVAKPSGESTSFNSPLIRNETELVLIESTENSLFTITLLSNEYTGATGHISIQISEFLPATESGQDRFEALRLISKASKANHRGDLDGWNSAMEAYKQAVIHARKAGDNRLLARSLFSIATIEYWQISNWDSAMELASQAAKIYQEIGNDHLAANAVQLQAAVIIEKAGEVEKSDSNKLAPEAQLLFNEALTLFKQALATQEKLGHHYDAAQITNNIGFTYYLMGDYDNATPYYHKAAASYRLAKEWQDELVPLGNLAVIDIEEGRLIQAIEAFQRVLEILPDDQLRHRADTLHNLGVSQLALGLPEDALQSFSNALQTQQEIDDLSGQGRCLAGIGSVYESTGKHELALEYLETAFTAQQEIKDGRGQTSTLKVIGKIKLQNGDFPGALEAHYAASRLVTAPIDKARIQQEISQDLIAANRPNEALESLAKADSMAADIRNQKLRADSLHISGNAWLKTDQLDQSLTAFEDASKSYHALGLDLERSRSIFGTAKAALGLGQTKQAQEQAELAIASVEKLRSQLVAPELRSFFLASRQEYYAFLIDTLMRLHGQSDGTSDEYLRQALSVSERSRARALVDLIHEASIDLGDTRQSLLYQRMAENRYRLNQLLEEQDESGLDVQIAGIRQELADIENELNLLQIELREQNPGYTALTDPQILDADQIQELLDADSALLQYALGEDRSFVWFVTRDSIEAWPLPGREVIEQDARKLHDLLQVPAFSAAAKKELATSLERLSGMVLGPVHQSTRKRLIVAADGVLHYLPFSVLDSPGQDDTYQPFLATQEIVHVPSMSVLATQRKNRQSPQQPVKEIAVFADPVFSATDNRFGDVPLNDETASSRGLPPQAATPGEAAQLKRLPATAHEARSIVKLVEPGQSLLALGFEANRELVMQANLGDYRIVHFATHGLIDSRYPALSSLSFSQFDKNGKPLDGSLHLHDIYKLELNADLVTMSACSTALGREIAGEGLTGLTQGLMYSGSRSVLASLWQVPDRATAELMKRFYQNLLDEKQKPATALRNAQLDLSSEPRWRSPYFWGAFVLQGEWQ
jgi:CHAT domain-containing protein/tetratricopeptide (TPR) repeat protein